MATTRVDFSGTELFEIEIALTGYILDLDRGIERSKDTMHPTTLAHQQAARVFARNALAKIVDARAAAKTIVDAHLDKEASPCTQSTQP